MTQEIAQPKTVDFTLSTVKEKPTRKYRKGSKYNPILNNYLEKTHKAKDAKDTLMSLDVPEKDANYMRTQLKKIIDKDKLPVRVSVVNNKVYLERVLIKEIKA